MTYISMELELLMMNPAWKASAMVLRPKPILTATIDGDFGTDSVSRETLDFQDGRKLLIKIGHGDTGLIALYGGKNPPRRPMTHQLMLNTLTSLGAVLDYVSIDRAEGSIFFASLHLIDKDDHEQVIDCRPSDAVCLALASHTEIMVSDDLLAQAAFPDFDRIEKEVNEEELADFRAALESLSSENLDEDLNDTSAGSWDGNFPSDGDRS